MALTRLRAATQVRRWYRRDDGRFLLTLVIRGTEKVHHQFWCENQIDTLDSHPGELNRAAAFEVWGPKVDVPPSDFDLYTMELAAPPY